MLCGTSTRLPIIVDGMLPVSPFRALAVCCLLAVMLPCHGDILSGVQLVTELSNSLVPKLFQALAPGRENLVFSPFGLATNVAMLLEAANGNTAREILKALNISPDSLPDLRTGFKVYCDSFEAAADNPEAAGSFNTALMVSSHPLLSSYKTLLKKFYRANITETSKFDNVTVKMTEGVAGARPAAVSLELRSDSGVMSHWKDYDQLAAFSFLSHETAAPFHQTSINIVPVPMVPQVGKFRAGRVHQLNAHAVELPLQVGMVTLLLLVPDSADNLDELLVKLPAVSLQQLVQEWLPYSETSVSLPQLTIISSAINVTPFLRQLGIRTVFNATSGNLSAASEAPAIYVKSVMQDAFFSVSFTSVNSVGSVSTKLVPKRLRRAATNLVVDRPFLFFLLHRDTQLVLLAGKVQNPTQVP